MSYIMKNQEWRLYDDGIVRVLKEGWFEVMTDMIEGHMQPVMLIYEKLEV